LCKNSKWKNNRKINTIGKIKWIKKNIFKVKTEIKNLLQIHNNKFSPKKGITLSKLVITVPAQNLICDQIKTYPKKASAIIIKQIMTPKFQTSNILKLKWKNPFIIWKKMNKKIKDTKFIWIIRKNQPKYISNIENSIEKKRKIIISIN